jgi:hypothetical protein
MRLGDCTLPKISVTPIRGSQRILEPLDKATVRNVEGESMVSAQDGAARGRGAE